RGGKANVLPDITSTGDELLKKIQHERRIELAFEDHRFFDVRRWKIADVTENKPARKITIVRDDVTKKKSYTIEVLQERKFLPQHYLLPIPRSEILRNSSLTQNPNYN
ncbi:MAG: RagB/SusD family nutrient uptake outer membrane protein, partial [Massilibacteroides sp.]|nr:RagB/SusD family nutrient uptake outer membrane protein [Massilibacteroides sp.]